MFNSKFQRINTLINQDNTEPKISIILPTHVKTDGNAIEKDRIRIRNSFRKIRNDITLDKELAIALKQAESSMMSDKTLKHLSKSIAVYISRKTFEIFHLDTEVTEVVHCGDQFIVSPLIIDKNLGSAMYVFHASLKQPCLFLHDGHELQQIEELDLPATLQEALNIDEYLIDKQHHVGARGGQAVHHGHGASDNKQDDIEVYYKRLANKLDTYLKGKTLPLLLIGTENHVSSLRSSLSYEFLLDEHIEGNYQNLNETEMGEMIGDMISGSIENEINQIEESLRQSPEDFVLNDPNEIDEATQLGQVKDLYLPVLRWTRDSVRPGKMKEALIDLTKVNINKLENIVRDVISQGGGVKALKTAFKDEAPLATEYIATLRYKLGGNNNAVQK